MPNDPLDPCPVCGAPVGIDVLSRHDGPGREAVLCGPPTHTQESPCLYYNLVTAHRRLCAEVALARVVMEHGDAIREYIDGALSVDRAHPRAVFELDAAIARVREESK